MWKAWKTAHSRKSVCRTHSFPPSDTFYSFEHNAGENWYWFNWLKPHIQTLFLLLVSIWICQKYFWSRWHIFWSPSEIKGRLKSPHRSIRRSRDCPPLPPWNMILQMHCKLSPTYLACDMRSWSFQRDDLTSPYRMVWGHFRAIIRPNKRFLKPDEIEISSSFFFDREVFIICRQSFKMLQIQNVFLLIVQLQGSNIIPSLGELTLLHTLRHIPENKGGWNSWEFSKQGNNFAEFSHHQTKARWRNITSNCNMWRIKSRW